jgi:hypothetical protein
MPRISTFDGIVIRMYWNDPHGLPHFHAQVGKRRASLAIGTGKVIVGSLLGRDLRRVRKWTALRREELEADWKLARAGKDLLPIEPLPRKGRRRRR